MIMSLLTSDEIWVKIADLLLPVVVSTFLHIVHVVEQSAET